MSIAVTGESSWSFILRISTPQLSYRVTSPLRLAALTYRPLVAIALIASLDWIMPITNPSLPGLRSYILIELSPYAATSFWKCHDTAICLTFSSLFLNWWINLSASGFWVLNYSICLLLVTTINSFPSGLNETSSTDILKGKYSTVPTVLSIN